MHQVDGLVYSAPIVLPFVMMAAVFGIGRLLQIIRPAANRTRTRSDESGGQSAFIRVHPRPVTFRTQINVDWRRFHPASFTLHPFLCGAILLCGLLDQHWYGYTFFGDNYRHLVVNEHHRRAAAIIEQIPPDAAVSAQDRLDPHVSQRETVYIFPRIDDPRIGRADTVFVDVTGSAWPQHPNDLRNDIDALLAADFGIAAADHGYLLLSTESSRREFSDSFYDAWRLPNFVSPDDGSVEFANGLRLLHHEVVADSRHELITKLYWQATEPLPDDVRFYVAYLDLEWNLLHDTLFYPPTATLWYPTSLWAADVPILVQTLPWSLDVERFVLALGVYQGEDGWQTGQRIPVVTAEPTLPLFEGNHLIRLGGYERVGQRKWHAIKPHDAPPGTSLDAHFTAKSGIQISLEGVTLASTKVQAGGELPLTLHWQSRGPLTLDYTIFVHLIASNGEKVAQIDWQPHDEISRLPTSAWIPEQPVVDAQVLPLPETLESGEYRLIVGLYHWQDGQRLPVVGSDSVGGDVIVIADDLEIAR